MVIMMGMDWIKQMIAKGRRKEWSVKAKYKYKYKIQTRNTMYLDGEQWADDSKWEEEGAVVEGIQDWLFLFAIVLAGDIIWWYVDMMVWWINDMMIKTKYKYIQNTNTKYK